MELASSALDETPEPQARIRSKPGRRPDPDAPTRILPAALLVYGERGWHGYNLHQVAVRAHVGKALLYSYWPNADDLLVEAFKQLAEPPEPDFELELRPLLIAEGVARLKSYSGTYGAAIMRISGEMRSATDPKLLAVHERVYREPSARLVRELRRRRALGEFAKEVSATALADALEGALYIHTILTPTPSLQRLHNGAEVFVARLVDQLLRGISYVPGRTESG